MKVMQERYAWIDATKGVAITLVVIGHAWRGIESAGLLHAVPASLFSAIDARIYAFHMPLFFLLSGLLLLPALTKLQASVYVKSRLVRLLYPLVLWTYIFAIMKVAAGDMANTPLQLHQIMISPIPGHWQFWFLWALLLLQLALFLLQPALRSDRWRVQTIWFVFAMSLVMQFIPLSAELHAATSNALSFLPYLALGLLLAQHRQDLFGTNHLGRVWLALFLTALILVPSLNNIGFPKVFTAIILCLSLIGFMVHAATLFPAVTRGLAFLGTYSMIIFLSHTIFSAGAREGLISIGVQDIALHMGLATLVGLVLPILLQQTFSHIASPKLLGV